MTSHLRVHVIIMLLLGIGLCSAQQIPNTTNPESIDIYNFDPQSLEKAGIPDYRQKAGEFYQSGNYKSAAQYYLAYLINNPDDATSWYNLSCCYGLLGSPAEAAKYLKISYRKGFKDLEHIAQDKDFEKVKDDNGFVSVVDTLKTWKDKENMMMGKMEYFPSRQYLPYWLHLPKDFDPSKAYTLLIGLHGFGDRAPNFNRLWGAMSDKNVILVVPEAPYPFPDDKQAGFSWEPFTDMQSPIQETAYQWLDDYINKLVTYMKGQYKIEQTWLLGFSQGAFNGYILTIKNPGVFDGLVACGGGLITEVFKKSDYRKAHNLKVIISHGTQDKVVDYSNAQKAYDVLQKAGLKVTKVDFEGGHMVSPTAIQAFLSAISAKR